MQKLNRATFMSIAKFYFDVCRMRMCLAETLKRNGHVRGERKRGNPELNDSTHVRTINLEMINKCPKCK